MPEAVRTWVEERDIREVCAGVCSGNLTERDARGIVDLKEKRLKIWNVVDSSIIIVNTWR